MEKETWRLEKEQMVKDFHVWNKDAIKGQTVFTGSSLMEMFPIEKWVKELGPNAPIVYNRGVGAIVLLICCPFWMLVYLS